MGSRRMTVVREVAGLACVLCMTAVPQLVFDGTVRYVDDGAVTAASQVAVAALTSLAWMGVCGYAAWRMHALLGHMPRSAS